MIVYSVVYYEEGTGVAVWGSPLFKSMEGLDAWMSIHRAEDPDYSHDIETNELLD